MIRVISKLCHARRSRFDDENTLLHPNDENYKRISSQRVLTNEDQLIFTNDDLSERPSIKMEVDIHPEQNKPKKQGAPALHTPSKQLTKQKTRLNKLRKMTTNKPKLLHNSSSNEVGGLVDSPRIGSPKANEFDSIKWLPS